MNTKLSPERTKLSRYVFPIGGILFMYLAIGEFFDDTSWSRSSIQKAILIISLEVILWILLYLISSMKNFAKQRLPYYFAVILLLISGGAQVISYLNSGAQWEIDLRFISTTLIGMSFILLRFDPSLKDVSGKQSQ